jgi:hypothetical protein
MLWSYGNARPASLSPVAGHYEFNLVKSDKREADALAKAYREAFGLDLTHSAEDRQLRADLAANPPSAAEARNRIAAALAVGDSLQARALAQLAWDSRNAQDGSGPAWYDVLETYGSYTDATARHMTNLATFAGAPSKIEKFQDRMQTEIVAPSGLSGNLDRLAADDAPSDARSMGANFGTLGAQAS